MFRAREAVFTAEVREPVRGRSAMEAIFSREKKTIPGLPPRDHPRERVREDRQETDRYAVEAASIRFF